MDVYDLGDPVPLELHVTGPDDLPVDPVSVELVLVDPTGQTAGPVAGVAHPGVGLFTFMAEPTVVGLWRARWTVTGAGAGEQEYAFVIQPLGSALPYEATVIGVRARVLEVARPAGAVPAGGTAKPARVTDARIAEWLLEAGGRVSRRLRLIDQVGTSEADPRRLQYRAAARGLVELYAAALLWDATYPQAAKGDRYGQVLHDRFKEGLDELVADLAIDVEAQQNDRTSVDADAGDLTGVFGGGGASAVFPIADPRITRWHPW
jgi:hypothetical protein